MTEKKTSAHLEFGKLTAQIHVYADPKLKELMGRVSDKAGLPLSEYIVRLLAEHVGRPELATVPRKQQGRPRKKIAV